MSDIPDLVLGPLQNSQWVDVHDEAHATAKTEITALESAADAVQLALPWNAVANGSLPLTNQPSTEQFLANSNHNIIKVDLSAFTQTRLTTRVAVGSASVNSPRLILKYSTTFTTTVGSYANIGTSAVQTSLASTGIIDSGWTTLASAARADVFIALTMIGGDGAADPSIGRTICYFR